MQVAAKRAEREAETAAYKQQQQRPQVRDLPKSSSLHTRGWNLANVRTRVYPALGLHLLSILFIFQMYRDLGGSLLLGRFGCFTLIPFVLSLCIQGIHAVDEFFFSFWLMNACSWTACISTASVSTVARGYIVYLFETPAAPIFSHWKDTGQRC